MFSSSYSVEFTLKSRLKIIQTIVQSFIRCAHLKVNDSIFYKLATKMSKTITKKCTTQMCLDKNHRTNEYIRYFLTYRMSLPKLYISLDKIK